MFSRRSVKLSRFCYPQATIAGAMAVVWRAVGVELVKREAQGFDKLWDWPF
jgi:hypothetical protein